LIEVRAARRTVLSTKAKEVLGMNSIVGLAALILLTSALPAGAQVNMEHLLGKYATTEDGCREGAAEFEIRRGIVEGPNLLCILGAPKEAGPGQEAYEAKCTQQGEVHLGAINLRPVGQARKHQDHPAGE
jgi:hypothetical protein